ncbi:MAG: SusC/RagA family TonB-linked outer membrane protein [Bacteroidota bacterium]
MEFLTQFMRIMRLTIVIITMALMQVSAAGWAQKVSLNLKNVPLEQVLIAVQKQTAYNFVYTEDVIGKAKPVNIKVNNVDLKDVLEMCFKGQPLNFSIEQKTIVIKEKEASFLDNLIARFQTIDVRGRVVDENGNGIAGATINVKGTNQSVSSGTNGVFTLTGVDEKAVILISYLGYTAKEVKVKIDLGVITMILNENPLDEVRIIAYGTTNQRLTTGNIGGIKAKDIEIQPVTNPLLTLQGRTSGVFINQTSGYAGAGVKVRIQGQNSIRYGNDPFYVVDGVPYVSQMLPTRSLVQGMSAPGLNPEAGAGNPFSYLNPADIESIDVLKDADATAIYGSRAANGAILITTKKGKPGETRIDATIQSGAGKLGRKMKLMNTQQYLTMRKEAYENDGIAVPTPAGSKDFTNFDLTVFDSNRYTDWQNELLGGSATYNNAQLSVSGGTAHTTFRLNGSYHRETTVLPHDFVDKKVSLGASIDHSSANNKFKLLFSANFLNDNNLLPNGDYTSTFLQLPPNAPALRKRDGTINWNMIEVDPNNHDSVSTWLNPLSYFENTFQKNTSNLVSNLNLSYLLAKGLSFTTSLGYTDMISSELVSSPLKQYWPEYRQYYERRGFYGDSRGKSWIFEPQINYNFSINKGRASLLAGSTFQENSTVDKQIAGLGFSSDEVIGNFQAASTIIPTNSLQALYKYNAVFGRLNYNWQDKYVINLTARRDGSSRFGKENRFHNFGAIGAAWLFSNENFIKKNLSFLSFGKIKGSYGTTGNDQIGNYTYLNQYSNITPAVPYQNFTGLAPTGLPNPYLQWELTKKSQAGIDLGFFKDRILFSVNFFRNRSSNQLLPYSLPWQTGYDGLLQNFPAKVQNKGWELTLNTTNLQSKGFAWSSSLNLTTNRNQLLEFPGLETSSYSSALIIGQPLSITKVYDYAGVDPTTGLYQFRAVDGKVVTSTDPQKDNHIIIDLTQKFYGGFHNSFSYKDFSLDFLFQFAKQMGGNSRTGFSDYVGIYVNQPVEVLNRWQKSGDQKDYQKFSTIISNGRATGSNFNYGDASYIKLKNLSLSYNIPPAWANTLHLKKARVFTQGQNLLTFTKYVGLDPETTGLITMPPLRTITLGLQIIL